jgi:hypothetical protein
MGKKRSRWVTGALVLQLLYTLMLLALPVYLLGLTRAPETRSGPDAQASITGLEIATAIIGGPALVGLVGWLGLWKEKLWGWWLTVLTDLGLVAALVYSMMDDGWHNIEWDVVVVSVIGVVPVVYLLLPQVRRFYRRGGAQMAAAAAVDLQR